MISEKAKIGTNVTIHPSSVIEDDVVIENDVTIGAFCIIKNGVHIGEGTTLMNYVELRNQTILGSHCYIDSRVSTSGQCTIGNHVTLRYDTIIARGCKIGDRTYISPRVMTNNLDAGKNSIGGAHIGADCFIGTNVVLHHGIHIGNKVTIGAMAFVSKDVPEGETWIGIPAKPYVKK
jgi:UDP-3-O-[3-hydroxymyristoyl] glucosamine N-acyltransferase